MVNGFWPSLKAPLKTPLHEIRYVVVIGITEPMDADYLVLVVY